MADNPSFSAMYRRGKFSRSENPDPNQNESKNDRREDFAVAAVAFVLQHDEKFKRHFIEKVCGMIIKATTNLDTYQILLHPKDFDLVLLHEDEIVVFEFKVDAQLDEHQKYFGGDFFQSENYPQGYGHQINEEHYADYLSRKYITVQKREKFETNQIVKVVTGSTGKEISCHSRSWRELFPEYVGATPLIRDLWDSLGRSFEIKELKSHFSMNQNLASSAQQAAEIYELLMTVADEFGETTAKPIGYNDETGYGFGVDLKGRPPGKFSFLKAHQDTNKRFIWFGYEPGAGRDVSVWICALLNNDHKKQVRNMIPENEEYRIEGDAGGSSLIISRTGRRIKDREWFKMVLKMLNDLE